MASSSQIYQTISIDNYLCTNKHECPIVSVELNDPFQIPLTFPQIPGIYFILDGSSIVVNNARTKKVLGKYDFTHPGLNNCRNDERVCKYFIIDNRVYLYNYYENSNSKIYVEKTRMIYPVYREVLNFKNNDKMLDIKYFNYRNYIIRSYCVHAGANFDYKLTIYDNSFNQLYACDGKLHCLCKNMIIIKNENTKICSYLDCETLTLIATGGFRCWSDDTTLGYETAIEFDNKQLTMRIFY